MSRDRIRVLVVEDSPSDVRLLCESLQGYPHQQFDIECAERLDEAVALLSQRAFDVILLDLNLPDSSGMETCKRLSAVAGPASIIILTGANDEAAAAEAMHLGVQDYLVKGQTPPGVIGRALRYAVERGQTQQALRAAKDELEIRVQERTAELAQHREHLEELVRERTRQLETANARLLESEQRVRRKLESVLSPEGDLGQLDLADLVDAAPLQRLIDDFHALTGLPIGILDMKGVPLVSAGWQDVCVKFHRVNPETCRNCLESDTVLSAGAAPGQSHLYKCRNNMWDMATPIIVAGQRLGNAFIGQFFFADETVDRAQFRAQARRYGFDEAEYLAALDRVPHVSRQTIERGMSFLTQLADTISQLGYSNVKLARLLVERDRLTDSLRQSENQLRTLANAIPQLAWVARADGYIYWYNQRWYEYTGTTPEQMEGWGWQSVHDPQELPRVLERWESSIATGRPFDMTFPLRGADGVFRPFLTRVIALKDEQGRVRQWFGTNTDVTEQKRAEEALRELTATLESKVAVRTAALERRTRQLQKLTLDLVDAEDRERRRLAEILHDDLQQVLAGAKFHLSVLRNRVKQETFLRTTGAQIDQMLSDAIEKSRSLSHQLRPGVLAHGSLTEVFAWLAGQMEGKHGLTVHLETVGAHVDTQLDAVKSFLYKATQELLFNVVKHAQVREAWIRLRRLGRYLCLTVRDRGQGFDPQSVKETAGFGLMNIRERVEMLGGRVHMRSAKGRGSTFLIVVPDREKAEPASPPETPPGRTLRVLLADDQKIVREGLVSLLSEDRSIDVVGEAGNGREAVELADRLRPDVVIMDVSMPLINGDEATRRIKARLPHTRIVALSMHEGAETAARMRRAGAESYVLKTDPFDKLFNAIRGRPPQAGVTT